MRHDDVLARALPGVEIHDVASLVTATQECLCLTDAEVKSRKRRGLLEFATRLRRKVFHWAGGGVGSEARGRRGVGVVGVDGCCAWLVGSSVHSTKSVISLLEIFGQRLGL